MLKHFSYGCSLNNFTKAVFLIISCLSNNPIIATSLNSEEKIIVENFLEGFINCFNNVSEAQLAQELSNVQTGIPGHKIKDPEKRAWKITEEIKKITRQNNGSNFKKIILILNTIYNYLGGTEGISDLQFADVLSKKAGIEQIIMRLFVNKISVEYLQNKTIGKWIEILDLTTVPFLGIDQSDWIISDRTGFASFLNSNLEENILNCDLDLITTTSLSSFIKEIKKHNRCFRDISQQEDLSSFDRTWAGLNQTETKVINNWIELLCKDISDHISQTDLKTFLATYLQNESILLKGLINFKAETKLKKIKDEVLPILKSCEDPLLKLLKAFGTLQKIIGGVAGSKSNSSDIQFQTEFDRLRIYLAFVGIFDKTRCGKEALGNAELAKILKIFANRFHPLAFTVANGNGKSGYENRINNAFGKQVTKQNSELIIEGVSIFCFAAAIFLTRLRKFDKKNGSISLEPFSGYETPGRSVQEIIDCENQNLQQIASPQPRQPQPYSLPAKSEKFDLYAKITDNSSQSRIRDSSSSYSYNNNANSQSRSQRSDASQGQSYSNGGSSSQCRPAANNLRYLQESLDFLGITKAIHDVSEDDVKFAFRIKAMKYHPDKNDSDEAKVYFQEFSNAKEEVLSHIKNRN